jgi:hypothetical protein
MTLRLTVLVLVDIIRKGILLTLRLRDVSRVLAKHCDVNSLYAKFQGRLSTWDGGPEVCAVHPLCVWPIGVGDRICCYCRTAAERALS